jgi:hypothetical protein
LGVKNLTGRIIARGAIRSVWIGGFCGIDRLSPTGLGVVFCHRLADCLFVLVFRSGRSGCAIYAVEPSPKFSRWGNFPH